MALREQAPRQPASKAIDGVAEAGTREQPRAAAETQALELVLRRSVARVIAISAPECSSSGIPSARSASLHRRHAGGDDVGVDAGVLQETCGVATIVRVPAATAARARASASSSVAGPSSIPGRMWQWRSITGR